ncbi:MAG: triose-phosphate isomerase [Bacteroidetes bacterium]|nr:MAG: triose-phosphate isomerase [Bacteroidota bacterium]
MRKKIVAGNWKMNKTLEAGVQLATEVVNIAESELNNGATVVLCTPAIHLSAVAGVLKSGKKVSLGAQNIYQKESGAFTGEISAEMVKSVGAGYVILGHSERREYFSETNAQLAEKVNLALKYNLTPIFCCGETLAQREAGIHIDFVKSQLSESLFHLSPEDYAKVVIAYEPIWAIGTGVTATSQQAQDMHKELRTHLASKYGKVGENTSILYGGSAKPSNAKELFSQPDIDGGLIGGASLVARDFIDIAKAF